MLLRKPCKLFAGVARVCQRQMGFLVSFNWLTYPQHLQVMLGPPKANCYNRTFCRLNILPVTKEPKAPTRCEIITDTLLTGIVCKPLAFGNFCNAEHHSMVKAVSTALITRCRNDCIGDRINNDTTNWRSILYPINNKNYQCQWWLHLHFPK